MISIDGRNVETYEIMSDLAINQKPWTNLELSYSFKIKILFH